MIKNAILYRLSSLTPLSAEVIEAGLQAHAFEPCGPTQEKSHGFVPPRGQAHGALVELVGGQMVMKLMTESKSVPAPVLGRLVDEKVVQILQSTGRKPGKKETRDLKDDARNALLPTAFPSQAATLIWIDPAAGLLVVGASGQHKADDVVTCLVRAVEGLAVRLLNTQVSPTAAMVDWLMSQEAPPGFSVDRACELRAADESKAVVRYGNHRLDTDEVKHHIEGGKMPTELAMTWSDRVSFVLTDGLQLKRIAFLEMVFEGSSKADSAADGFDADVAIMTGELGKLIVDLVSALGGEMSA
ncbi:recombination-associated protein RdgC [Rhodoferax sp.]|uniref:recombination-associated protein RdgC n=1 Tax=Rhodoferax sp. TaxID=50421 RepID=UPI002604FF95|nr:recombination-associated protein RdgC [Rhodoferax sp.]MDD5479659.1 recombination-associated protein RdgC [Rhodoferax sp.]